MFRRPKFVIVTAAVLYAIALVVVWHGVTVQAETRTNTILTSAEKGFAAVISGEIEAALRNVGGSIIGLFGGKCSPQPIERMQEIARTFNLDELNVVNRAGIAVASNIKSVLGFDFSSNAYTREFLTLTNEVSSMVSQPFRPGIANPDMICHYYGLPFPNHDGLLQLGITREHLRENMYSYSDAEARHILKEWHFSVVGWYERVPNDDAFDPGKVFRCVDPETGEKLFGRQFEYVGYRYVAYLPVSYCYGQRNAVFLMMTLVLGVLMSVFTFFLVKLQLTSGRLETMHAEADARAAEDLALAKTIQMSSLPSPEGAFLDCLELSLAAESHPAREVGGDFYDFYSLSDGRIAFLVADVSGKGIPAAMFMMETKNIIKNCLVEFSDVAEAVQNANVRICAQNRAELFVTAWVGVLNANTGDLEYVNAGHNRPFLRHDDGTVEKVHGKGGRFLGMFEDATYRSCALKLARNDELYVYTDGVTEAMNAKDEQFGEIRLRDALAKGAEHVRSALERFVGDAEQSDDLTGMLIWWHGAPKSADRSFACDENSLASAVEFIRTALDGVGRKPVAKVLNAADEIVSNIVNYSKSADFKISVRVCPDRVLVRFADAGLAYNPLSHVDPDVHAKIADRPVGGLGLVMVKRLADRVSYARKNGENVLTMIVKTRYSEEDKP